MGEGNSRRGGIAVGVGQQFPVVGAVERGDAWRMSDAITRYTAMVVQHPGNELVRFSLAKALFDRGAFAEAIPHFEKALEKRADWMVVTILLGRSQLAMGDKAAARANFERARQLAIEQHHEGPLAELDQLLSELN